MHRQNLFTIIAMFMLISNEVVHLFPMAKELRIKFIPNTENGIVLHNLRGSIESFSLSL